MPNTLDKLAEQWTEPTGVHMLDSGGDNNRNWQRNQGKTATDFLAEREVTVDEYGVVSVNTFAFCANHFHYTSETEALTRSFRKWVDAQPAREHYCNHWDSVVSWLYELDATGPNGIGHPIASNTYNWENLLDSVLQVVDFELGGVRYVALSYHGGADVRGGYTDYVIYRGCDDWAYQTQSAYLACPNELCEQEYTIDDGYQVRDMSSEDVSLTNGACVSCGHTVRGIIGQCWER